MDPAIEDKFLGTMSLPRELSLGEDGLVSVKPIEELKSLRYGEVALENLCVAGEMNIPEVAGRQLEIELKLEADTAKQAGLKVLCAQDEREETLVYYDFVRQEVVIDTSASSQREDLFSPVKLLNTLTDMKDRDKVREALADEMREQNWNLTCDLVNKAECFVQRLPMKLDKEKSVMLRVFVDASIIEVFVNDTKCMTQRVYPKYEQSELVRLFAKEGTAKISYLKSWKMDTTNAW